MWAPLCALGSVFLLEKYIFEIIFKNYSISEFKVEAMANLHIDCVAIGLRHLSVRRDKKRQVIYYDNRSQVSNDR